MGVKILHEANIVWHVWFKVNLWNVMQITKNSNFA